MARRALILVDGLDEAGTVRDQIETHVAEVLTPQGHVLLATSRPAGDERVDRDKIHIRALRVFSIVYDACRPTPRLGSASRAMFFLTPS